MAIHARPALRLPTAVRRTTARTRNRLIAVGAVVAGSGTALITGLDGSPWWCAVRVIVVAALSGAIVLVSRRPLTRGAGALIALLGLVAVAAGGTVAVSFLTTTGLSARAIGGTLAAAGGLLLAGLGTAAVVRSFASWRKLLVLPAVAVAAYVVAWPVTIAVYATNVPRPALGAITPAERGLSYVDATFRTADGVLLSGWYVPSANRAAVVLLHGASSTRASVLDQAAVLARHGYGVLLYDARGHGRSEGRAMELGWYGDMDLAAAVTYLQGRPEIDPQRIAAAGLSMGGEEAIGAMAHDRRIAAVVAEGATNRVPADRAWLSEQHGLRGWFTERLDTLTYGLADLLTDAGPPTALRDAVTAAGPRPILLIAAGDVADEVAADVYIQAASPATVELWVVPGAGHTRGLQTEPAAWEARVVTFLDRVLQRG